jgi:hypothetical protein
MESIKVQDKNLIIGGVKGTGNNFSPVTTIPGNSLSQMTLTLVKSLYTQSCDYLQEFSKNSKWRQWNTQGPGETDS